ncbi:MAG: phosphatidate cytidylyltransferase [Lachnospiraceae bacterium]|nr:phosphatidate cytidylyltransferase [Candidatus Equihabitans merdae]
MLVRLISGIVMLAIAIGAILKGGLIMAALFMVLTIMAMREYYSAMGISGHPVSLMELVAYIGAAGYYVLVYFKLTDYQMPFIVLCSMALLIIYVLTYDEYKNVQVAVTLFPFIYIVMAFGFLYMTRCRFRGNLEVWMIFLSSWGADTCAYCVGRLIGRHKMSPKLSPHKTIEGAVGGVIGAGLLGLIFALIFKQPVLIYMLICAGASVASIFGDLAASAVKREARIKDYSRLIPGHGGILDRFDSLLFTAPIVYICSMLFLS